MFTSNEGMRGYTKPETNTAPACYSGKKIMVAKLKKV
jgi:hypothetical protein